MIETALDDTWLTINVLLGLDHSAPIGPVLVSPSAIQDPQALGIRATLNGSTVQDSHTKEMIFSVAKTIAFLSQGTTLERGTVIMMGTPPGKQCTGALHLKLLTRSRYWDCQGPQNLAQEWRRHARVD